jgi:hypothetical protein
MYAREGKERMALARGAGDLAALGARNAASLATRPADGAGERMPAAVQHKMERAFGFDFSAVRIHHDDQARSVGALAFAQGTDLHFAPGQYAPQSQAGQAVLGHELAHVVQQAAGRVRAPAQALGGAINDDPELEREADRKGARAAAGKPVSKEAEKAAQPDEGLENTLERVRVGKSEAQPIQRKVEVPSGTTLPSFHKHLTKSGNIYSYDHVDRTKGKLSLEIFTSLFNSPRVFKLQGDTGERAESSLMRHIAAREGVTDFARSKQYKFTGGTQNFHMNPKYWWWDKAKGSYGLMEGVDIVTASKDLKATPSEYTIGCAAATKLTVEGGGESREARGTTDVDQDWVPGDAGYIKNEGWDGRPGLEGENIIYLGAKEFWGHFANAVAVKPYTEWLAAVNGWNKYTAKLQPDRSWPGKGLSK